MKLAIAKCLHSPEYLSALGTAVSKAIEKCMQDGLAAGITHGREGRVLTDVSAHNPAAEAGYLMVPIHHSLYKTVVGASAFSLPLDVLDARVRRIGENIMSHRSLFQDVFVPLAEPLSVAALTCMIGTFGATPATADLTTALSVTLASAGNVTPLFVDDYGVMGTDDQSAVDESVVDENANLFPYVNDEELNIPWLLIFQVRESYFPSRSLSLYAPFPSDSVTSYGPSHLGPGFLVSSTRLASLLRYTKSPGLKLVLRTFELYYFFIFALLLASRIAACSFLSFKWSKLISRASLFPTRSTSTVLSVGMPISSRMTVSVPYVNENGVSSLLDFLIVRCAHRT
nr:hypothetical protein [Tanacetum cinerariifolium]